MAKWLISQGKKVIIAGRTESNLQSTCKELGCTAYYVLDTGKTESIKPFVATITKEHPDLNGLINNAGVQKPIEVDKMQAEDFLSTADQEISINIKGPVHLAVELLPHFKAQKQAVIMNVSSVLGFVPFSTINPIYNGTKAFVHLFTINLREQLARSHNNIRVIEIAPPAVGTDLHRDREDPDDNKPHKNPTALSTDQFMKELTEAWKANVDCASAGPGVKIVKQWHDTFMPTYEKMKQ